MQTINNSRSSFPELRFWWDLPVLRVCTRKIAIGPYVAVYDVIRDALTSARSLQNYVKSESR